MGKLILFSLLLFSFALCQAQNSFEGLMINDDGKIEMYEVIEADTLASSVIYTRVRTWFSDMYTDSREVLEIDDKETGLLIGTGFHAIKTSLGLGMMQEGRFWHTTKVEIKEGRFRFSIYEIMYQPRDVSGIYLDKRPIEIWFGDDAIKRNGKMKKNTQEFLAEILTTFNSFKKSIDESVNSKSNKSDWR